MGRGEIIGRRDGRAVAYPGGATARAPAGQDRDDGCGDEGVGCA